MLEFLSIFHVHTHYTFLSLIRRKKILFCKIITALISGHGVVFADIKWLISPHRHFSTLGGAAGEGVRSRCVSKTCCNN